MGEPYNDAFVETSILQKRSIPISVLREEMVSKYPYWVTRELLMNAIMHRDYEGNAPIYNPQIEIVSPAETKQYFNIFILKNEMV